MVAAAARGVVCFLGSGPGLRSSLANKLAAKGFPVCRWDGASLMRLRFPEALLRWRTPIWPGSRDVIWS